MFLISSSKVFEFGCLLSGTHELAIPSKDWLKEKNEYQSPDKNMTLLIPQAISVAIFLIDTSSFPPATRTSFQVSSVLTQRTRLIRAQDGL